MFIYPLAGSEVWDSSLWGRYLLGLATSGRSITLSQEPSGCLRTNYTRTPVLSAERVEVSAKFSNSTVGNGVSRPNLTSASIICW
jgi:hypothetical protein